MIFGQAPTTAGRMPFKRPQDASYYTPQMPQTGFMTHWNPLMHVMPSMPSFRARIPNMPRGMSPGVMRSTRSIMRNQMPPQGRVAAQTALPSGINGFGHPGGASPFDFMDTDPAVRMRTGMPMNVNATPASIRAGVNQAGKLLQRLAPASFPNAIVPAGSYR